MDFTSNIIAVIALIVSIISFLKSHSVSQKANMLTVAANDLTKGQVEMQIREMISSSKARYADLAIQLSKEKDDTCIPGNT